MQEKAPKKSRQIPRLSRILYDENGRYGIGGLFILSVILFIAVLILVFVFTDLGFGLKILASFAIYAIIVICIVSIAILRQYL